MWLKPFVKSVVLISVLRTIFYQFLLIAIGLTIGFILNAEYLGWKSSIISKSINNIFYPVKFDQNVCQTIKNWGAMKIWTELNRPLVFEIIQDGLLNEELYICKYKTIDQNNKTIINIETTRIRWKPWEYYWEEPRVVTDEELKEYHKNGTLNSQESDKAYKLFQERQKNNQLTKEKK